MIRSVSVGRDEWCASEDRAHMEKEAITLTVKDRASSWSYLWPAGVSVTMCDAARRGGSERGVAGA